MFSGIPGSEHVLHFEPGGGALAKFSVSTASGAVDSLSSESADPSLEESLLQIMCFNTLLIAF
jgi:hypothetical protein